MNTIFKMSNSPAFQASLAKTVKKFEDMPTQEFFDTARQHANGDIAKFVAHTDQSN